MFRLFKGSDDDRAKIAKYCIQDCVVVTKLLEKLKTGGRFYIEYPGKKSLKLPSMYGTLNFHDDPTHVRVYSIDEIKHIMETNNCIVLDAGIRRNWYYIFLMPFRIIYYFIIYLGFMVLQLYNRNI